MIIFKDSINYSIANDQRTHKNLFGIEITNYQLIKFHFHPIIIFVLSIL